MILMNLESSVDWTIACGRVKDLDLIEFVVLS